MSDQPDWLNSILSSAIISLSTVFSKVYSAIAENEIGCLLLSGLFVCPEQSVKNEIHAEWLENMEIQVLGPRWDWRKKSCKYLCDLHSNPGGQVGLFELWNSFSYRDYERWIFIFQSSLLWLDKNQHMEQKHENDFLVLRFVPDIFLLSLPCLSPGCFWNAHVHLKLGEFSSTFPQKRRLLKLSFFAPQFQFWANRLLPYTGLMTKKPRKCYLLGLIAELS